MRTIQKLTGIFKNCPDNLETVCLKDYILAILPQFVICLGFTRICREIVDVAIYALYPESFCGGNLAIWKVFAFSDSECGRNQIISPNLVEYSDDRSLTNSWFLI